MFAALRERSEITWQQTCNALLDHCSLLQFALLLPNDFLITGEEAETETYIMAERPQTAVDPSFYHSTASAPSLRSKEPMELMDRPRTSDGDANVKVVVRVRKFIKRGLYTVNTNHIQACILTPPSRHRERFQMHRSNDSRNTRDSTPPPRNRPRRPQTKPESVRRKIIHIRQVLLVAR